MPVVLRTTATNLPLQNKVDKAFKTIRAYERLNEEQSQNIEELKNILENIEKKYTNWIDKFTGYKIENFTILDQYRVVHHSSTQYLDELGRVHDTPLQFFSLVVGASSEVSNRVLSGKSFVPACKYILTRWYVCPRVVTRVLVWGCGGAENLSEGCKPECWKGESRGGRQCPWVCLFVRGL
jgi:hypothetical protein